MAFVVVAVAVVVVVGVGVGVVGVVGVAVFVVVVGVVVGVAVVVAVDVVCCLLLWFFVAGVVIVVEKLSMSLNDFLLALSAGFFQIGFGFILITIGSQTTPAAVIGVLMLTESVFGPLWAWLFINETPPIGVLIGGTIIIISILFQSFLSKKV